MIDVPLKERVRDGDLNQNPQYLNAAIGWLVLFQSTQYLTSIQNQLDSKASQPSTILRQTGSAGILKSKTPIGAGMMNGSLSRSTGRLCSIHPSCLHPRLALRTRLTRSSHQRRKSSSSAKPPKSGPQAPVAVQQKGKTVKDTTRTDALSLHQMPEISPRRRTRGSTILRSENDHPLRPRLPSVPSTSYLHPADVAVSTFFSQHRPISITSAIPDTDAGTSFEKIFNKPGRKTAQVIDVLSGAVSKLEESTAVGEEVALDQKPDPYELRQAVDPVSIHELLNNHHQGGVPQPSSDALTRSNYQPFNPPPAPRPQRTTFTPVTYTNQAGPRTSQALKMVIRIHEQIQPNGAKSVNIRMGGLESDSEPLEMTFADPNELLNYTLHFPAKFLDRMQGRRQAFVDRMMAKISAVTPEMMVSRTTEGTGMLAISVKRQRKLKMKKHKYKKLMRRTRSLRRRIDRT